MISDNHDGFECVIIWPQDQDTKKWPGTYCLRSQIAVSKTRAIFFLHCRNHR